ncbi:hypothetical protein WJX75_006053 [Coccomyxa subellipsoidea]|uniref:Uncharacterized protein n=1 Tax=Coccomyxa subellipsoidea TaxID=248742 RepID=A0ABR2YW89_9CHLO
MAEILVFYSPNKSRALVISELGLIRGKGLMWLHIFLGALSGRGKSGLLTSLHAQSRARRPLQQAQTPMSPSLPKAARADPALVNFAISASREKQGSPLLRAESASEITVDGSLVQESAHVLQPAMADGDLKATLACGEVQQGAWKRLAPAASSPMTSAQSSWLRSSQHAAQPPAASAHSQARSGSAWVPMQPAQRRGLQPLGSGKLRIARATPPSMPESEVRQPQSTPASSTALLEASSPDRPAVSSERRSAKVRSKERLEELQEMLRELGGLVLPQPQQPASLQVLEHRPLSASTSDEGWAQERLGRLRDLQAEAAGALAAREEDRPPLSSGAEELAKALANATPVALRAASSNTRTQPALRQRPSGSDGGSVGGHEARPAAHRARSSVPAADGAEAHGACCDRFWDDSGCMGAVRRERHRLVFVFVILHILFAKGSNLQGVQRIHRPGRKLLQCTTEAACRARCPAGNNVIYLAPQDGTSGQCVCICSPTSSQQNSTPSTRSNSGLIGSSSFAQPLAGGGSGGNGNGGIATGGQTTTGTTSPDSGSTESPTTVPAQSSGSGSLGGSFNSASQQGTGSGSNLVGTVQSSGSSSATTTATLVNSATGSGTSGSGGSSTARLSRTPAQSG